MWGVDVTVKREREKTGGFCVMEFLHYKLWEALHESMYVSGFLEMCTNISFTLN